MDFAGLALVASGIWAVFSWQPLPGNESAYECVVRVEPSDRTRVVDGHPMPLVCDVPTAGGAVGRIRVVLDDRQLPPQAHRQTCYKPAADESVELAQYSAPYYGNPAASSAATAQQFDPYAKTPSASSGAQLRYGTSASPQYANPQSIAGSSTSNSPAATPAASNTYGAPPNLPYGPGSATAGPTRYDLSAGPVERVGHTIQQATEPLREGVQRVDERLRNAADRVGDRTRAFLDDVGRPLADRQPLHFRNRNDGLSSVQQPTPSPNNYSQTTAAPPNNAATSANTAPSYWSNSATITNTDGWATNGRNPTAAPSDGVDRSVLVGSSSQSRPSYSNAYGNDANSVNSRANAWQWSSMQQHGGGEQAADRPSLALGLGSILASRIGEWFGADDTTRVAANPQNDSRGPVFPEQQRSSRSNEPASATAGDFQPFASFRGGQTTGEPPAVNSNMLRRRADAELEGDQPVTTPVSGPILPTKANANLPAAGPPTSLSPESTAGSPDSKPRDAQKQSPAGWGAVLLAWVLLSGSVAGNLYLLWSYLDVRAKFQSLNRQAIRSARGKPSAA